MEQACAPKPHLQVTTTRWERVVLRPDCRSERPPRWELLPLAHRLSGHVQRRCRSWRGLRTGEALRECLTFHFSLRKTRRLHVVHCTLCTRNSCPPDAAAIPCALIFRGEGEMTDPARVEFVSERMIVPLIRRSGFEDRPRVPYHEGLNAKVGPTLRPWAPSSLAADLLGTHRADLDMRLRHAHSAGPDHPFPRQGSDQLPATRTRPCR